MGTIYEIICWTTGRRYVGSTTKTLKRRLQKHESDFRNRFGSCSSCLVFKHGNYEIYELERVEDEGMLKETEYYYIQHTDCVNIIDRHFDHKEFMKKYMKEYYEANKEKRKEYKKEYNEANREKINEKKREKISCPCGGHYSKSGKARHEKREIHLNFLKNNSINKDEKES